MMLVTVWVFSGVEGASVFSQRAASAATSVGRQSSASCSCSPSTCSSTSCPAGSCRRLRSPDWPTRHWPACSQPWSARGEQFIAIGLIISLLGSTAVLGAAVHRDPARARDRRHHAQGIGKLNEHGTPTVALWASNICAQVALVLTFFSASTYEVLIFLAAGVILIPYLWAALFQLKTALKAERITQGKSLTYERVIGALAVIYAIWLLYAGRDYILPRRPCISCSSRCSSRRAGSRRYYALQALIWVVLGVLALMTAVFIVQVATGPPAYRPHLEGGESLWGSSGD